MLQAKLLHNRPSISLKRVRKSSSQDTPDAIIANDIDDASSTGDGDEIFSETVTVSEESDNESDKKKKQKKKKQSFIFQHYMQLS